MMRCLSLQSSACNIRKPPANDPFAGGYIISQAVEKVADMSITKTSIINKQNMLLAHGSKDTCIHNPQAEYKGITLAEIAVMVGEPQATEKADAAFFIPSTYRKHDGRKHAAQREHGEYWMLAVDIDKGSPSLTDVKEAINTVTGDAAALIYSSSGASEDERKWRVLIPLAEPLSGTEYVEAQMALFEQLEREHGIICDAALSRAGQPIYLPNVPPARRDDMGAPMFYHGVKHRGQGYLIAKQSRIWAGVEFARKQAQIAEQQAAVERERRMQKRAERAASGDVDVVAEFNARHSVADTLLHYGYEKDGRSPHYRSRYQTTGSYATRDFGEYWVSLSTSDADAGIGARSGGDKKSTCWGDAFDLYCHYEHSGDMTAAVRTYAAEIKPTPTDIIKDSFSDFDFVQPEPEPAQEGGPTVITENTTQMKLHRTFDADSARPVLTSSYLVKGWLGKSQMSVVYGPSNVGKSFFCLDIAFAVAANVEWFGNKVRGGAVLYLATEGGNAFRNRVYAKRQQSGISGAKLIVRPSPVDLLRAEVDMPALGELCREVKEQYGEIAMIVVDTLSRAMAGGNENGPEDMTRLIGNLDVLRDLTGAHVLIVHHSGKDTAAGARGHSSLRAATDTEIELDVDESGLRIAKTTKQRDMEPKDPFGFKLNIVELGLDEDGDKVTTCTIEPASEDDVMDANVKRPSGSNQVVVAQAFRQLRAEGVGGPNPAGVGWPEYGEYWCIPEGRLRDHAKGKLTDKANPDSAYSSAIKGMISSGYMQRNEGQIWIAAKEGRVVK